MPEINPAWLRLGFEVNDGMFAFIVTDVHADTIETFDTEGVVDLQSHEEWHEWVTECLKDGGSVAEADDHLGDRLKEWTEYHPATFPIGRF
jgi:hypothetical protein